MYIHKAISVAPSKEELFSNPIHKLSFYRSILLSFDVQLTTLCIEKSISWYRQSFLLVDDSLMNTYLFPAIYHHLFSQDVDVQFYSYQVHAFVLSISFPSYSQRISLLYKNMDLTSIRSNWFPFSSISISCLILRTKSFTSVYWTSIMTSSNYSIRMMYYHSSYSSHLLGDDSRSQPAIPLSIYSWTNDQELHPLSDDSPSIPLGVPLYAAEPISSLHCHTSGRILKRNQSELDPFKASFSHLHNPLSWL